MPIRFHCEACEARVKVPAGSEGRKVKCPRCGALQRVPQSADQRVAVGVSVAEEGVGDDSGSFEAQPESHETDRISASATTPVSTSTKSAPRKGGLDAGDSLGDLAERFSDKRDMTPPDVAARAMEKHDREQQTHVAPAPKPAPAPPKALPLVGWSDKKKHQPTPPPAPAELEAAREQTPYVALRNLATALRVTPALMIPAVLWHILNAATLSGSIVTLITGGSIVAVTWTLAEIADAVRDMAIER